jgi:hypothetical protein
MNLSLYNSNFYFNCLKKQLLKSILNLKAKIPSLKLYNQRYINNSNEVSKGDYDNDWHFVSRKIISKEVIDILFDAMINITRLNEYVLNNKILSKQSLSVKINSKYLGTLFSVSYFNNIVCTNKVCLKDKLITLANKLTILIDQIDESASFNLIKLSVKSCEYISLFKQWGKLDKEYTVYTLAKQYLINEIKLTAPLSENEDVNSIYLNMFKNEQTNIKSEITYLGDRDLKNLFFELITSVNNFNNIEKTLYWLDVNYSLQKENPDLSTVLNLFKESKRLMKNLVEREDLKLEIDNVIDEYIIQTVLEEDDIDQVFYFEKCNFILDWLGKMQSAANDQNLNKFKQEFEYKINNKTYFYELIPLFFRFVLDSLEIIHEEKVAFINFVKELNK